MVLYSERRVYITCIQKLSVEEGHAIAEVFSRWPVTTEAQVHDHVGFVVDIVALGQVFL
jgi:hypothetical protein